MTIKIKDKINKIGLSVLFSLFIFSINLPLEANYRFSEDNKPNSKEVWRSRARVDVNEMKKITGETFTSAQNLINKSGIIYEECVFEGPIKLSDCSSIHFINCRFNLKGVTNKRFVELFYTDDIVFKNTVFENANYDNFRHYATIYNSPLIYNEEKLRRKDPILTDITYNTKWVNAIFIHHGGDVTFSKTTIKNVWVVKEASLLKFTKSLSEKLKIGLRDVNWRSIAPYVFRFEGNTRLIIGEVTGADAFEGLSYSPTSSYESHDEKMPTDLDATWNEAVKKIGKFRRGIYLNDMVCREGFSDPEKRSSSSSLFKGSDSIPGSIQKILLKGNLSFISKKRMKAYEIPVKRLAFTESEIETLRKYFKSSWYCAFRLLYLCEKFQRTAPERRGSVKKAIQFYSMALLHGMHPPRSIYYSNGRKYAGWNHKLLYAERKKGTGKNKEEQIFVDTKGAAYQGRPLLSCSSICLWALSRARQCGANFDQNLFSLAMLSFRNSISNYSVSFPYQPEQKDKIIVDNMDRIYLMDSYWKKSKGIHLSGFNKPFYDSEMLPRNGMIYLAMTSTGMEQFSTDITDLRKLLRYSSGCASAAHGAPSFGLWIYSMSTSRMGDEAADALYAQHANLYNHHLSKSWLQFMPVADTKAESDAPPKVFSTLKVKDGSVKKLYAQWKKTSDSINNTKYFKQQQRFFYNGKQSESKTYESAMAGYANTLGKKFSRFKKYCDEHSIKDSVTVNSADPYYGLYIAIQSSKSLTSYSHTPTEFLTASVALRKSRPWIVCMPGTGGYGNPIVLKAESAVASPLFDDKSKKKISDIMQDITKEDAIQKKDGLYAKLLSQLCSTAKKVQRNQKEIPQLFLPEVAWRTQKTGTGLLLFLMVGGDSLLNKKFIVKTDAGDTLIKSSRLAPDKPLFYRLSLPSDCKALNIEWSYSKTKHSESISIVEGEEGHIRQIQPVLN